MNMVNLALNVTGDIASIEMLRDLMPDIENILASPNPHMRKKSALVAVRAVRKFSEEEDIHNILSALPSYFDTRSSAVHVAGSSLLSSIYQVPYLQMNTLIQLQDYLPPIIVSILYDHTTDGTSSKPTDVYGNIG